VGAGVGKIESGETKTGENSKRKLALKRAGSISDNADVSGIEAQCVRLRRSPAPLAHEQRVSSFLLKF
jgi:hypothetical protein